MNEYVSKLEDFLILVWLFVYAYIFCSACYVIALSPNVGESHTPAGYECALFGLVSFGEGEIVGETSSTWIFWIFFCLVP